MAYPNGTKFTVELCSLHEGDAMFQILTKFHKTFFVFFSSSKFFFFFVISYTLQKSPSITRVCELAEIWHMYWGSKGEYQHRFLGKSDQQ